MEDLNIRVFFLKKRVIKLLLKLRDEVVVACF